MALLDDEWRGEYFFGEQPVHELKRKGRADLAKRNMAMFEDASRAFSSKLKPEPNPSASSDMEQLKAELAALQAKVDKLSR